MTVSVVNGFVCYSSCDVSKAKKGKDPHPSTGAGNVDQDSEPSSPGRADQPAVVFGGSLPHVRSRQRHRRRKRAACQFHGIVAIEIPGRRAGLERRVYCRTTSTEHCA